MTVRSLYEKVTLKTPIEQRKFFSFLNDTINELSAMYGLVTVGGSQLSEVNSLSDGVEIKSTFEPAIVDNVLFLAGAGEHHKGEFLRKADAAYIRSWREQARGKRIKQGGW